MLYQEIAERRARIIAHNPHAKARILGLAPSGIAGKSARITVDCRTGTRTIERIAEQVAADAIETREVSERIAARAQAILTEAIEKAAKSAAAARIAELSPPEVARPFICKIAEVVAAVTDCSVANIYGPRRSRNIVYPRFLLCALLRELRPDLSLPTIGKALGKDHTSIMHALARFERLKDASPFSGWLADPRVVALRTPSN